MQISAVHASDLRPGDLLRLEHEASVWSCFVVSVRPRTLKFMDELYRIVALGLLLYGPAKDGCIQYNIIEMTAAPGQLFRRLEAQ